MQNTKSNLWVPDTRPESVSAFTESYTPSGGQEQTAAYKAIPNHAIIGGILNKLSFSWGHAKATWYNKLAGKTVADKFNEVDAAVQALNTKTSFINLITYEANASPGDATAKAAILSAPQVRGRKFNVIFVANKGGANELIIGQDIGLPYLVYLKISYYEGLKLYTQSMAGWNIKQL